MTHDPYNLTEEFRLAQKGMGYLQFHAAVTWMRSWLKANNVASIEHGNAAGIGQMLWEVDDGKGLAFWLSFDLKSLGHLLYSLDRENWCGMDVTYHPAEGETSPDNWRMVCRRARLWRDHGPMGQVYKLARR